MVTWPVYIVCTKALTLQLCEVTTKNIMVVIFMVINTTVATTKCRELVTSQMWLMRISFYLFSVSVTA